MSFQAPVGFGGLQPNVAVVIVVEGVYWTCISRELGFVCRTHGS